MHGGYTLTHVTAPLGLISPRADGSNIFTTVASSTVPISVFCYRCRPYASAIITATICGSSTSFVSRRLYYFFYLRQATGGLFMWRVESLIDALRYDFKSFRLKQIKEWEQLI